MNRSVGNWPILLTQKVLHVHTQWCTSLEHALFAESNCPGAVFAIRDRCCRFVFVDKLTLCSVIRAKLCAVATTAVTLMLMFIMAGH